MKYSLLPYGLICYWLFFGLTGCTTFNPYTGEEEVSKTSIGTGIGAVGGALAGQMIGGDTTSTVIGAAAGSAIGGITGNYMDRQARELRQQLSGTGVQVIKVGKDLRLVMPGDVTFSNNRADISSGFYRTLDSVTIILKKFNRTTVRIAGYASDTGNSMYNQKLSERRAHSVADYFISRGIDPNRIMVIGYGARYPIATNATPAGQAQNRRVEITIHQLN